MKLLTYILIIVFPLTLLAHKASKEEIDKLKAQADSARQEYRTAKSKHEASCRKNRESRLKGEMRALQESLEARKKWIRVCEQSTDPEIVKAFKSLNNSSLSARSKFYDACKKSTDPKVVEAYEQFNVVSGIKCFRLRESYIDAKVKLREALAAYNNTMMHFFDDEIIRAGATANAPIPAGSGAGSGAVQ